MTVDNLREPVDAFCNYDNEAEAELARISLSEKSTCKGEL